MHFVTFLDTLIDILLNPWNYAVVNEIYFLDASGEAQVPDETEDFYIIVTSSQRLVTIPTINEIRNSILNSFLLMIETCQCPV